MKNREDHITHSVSETVSACVKIIFAMAEKHFSDDNDRTIFSKCVAVHVFGHVYLTLVSPLGGMNAATESVNDSLETMAHWYETVGLPEMAKKLKAMNSTEH